ncbi:OmpA family protein [Candidatus Venteria ishoeyi]|uniref:OmpA family protein n=1 Tax=Candidatus Venteria ishoeyi TaxID=1899563 RepID=UPI0025A59A93|nr:OmpA family protein [Candidatus Venteria ishoeyi]MDM8546989.1 OmpA family protein [Candidatus Venteria ishoeyi]
MKPAYILSVLLLSFNAQAAEVYQNLCAPANTDEILHFLDTRECADAQLPEYQAKGVAAKPVYSPKGILGIAKDRAVVLFAFDSSVLRPDTQPVLNSWGQALQQRPDLKLALVGHTDALGTASYNHNLSWQRAQAVLVFLQRYHHLPAQRFKVQGLGESQPLYVGCQQAEDSACQHNRRVEFVLLE